MSFSTGFNNGIAVLRHRLLCTSDCGNLASTLEEVRKIRHLVGLGAVGHPGMREKRELVLNFTNSHLMKLPQRPLWWGRAGTSYVPILPGLDVGVYYIGETTPQCRDLWARECPKELVLVGHSYWLDVEGKHYDSLDMLAVPFGRGIRELEKTWKMLPKLGGPKVVIPGLLDDTDCPGVLEIIDTPLVELRRYAHSAGHLRYESIRVGDGGELVTSSGEIPAEGWEDDIYDLGVLEV